MVEKNIWTPDGHSAFLQISSVFWRPFQNQPLRSWKRCASASSFVFRMRDWEWKQMRKKLVWGSFWWRESADCWQIFSSHDYYIVAGEKLQDLLPNVLPIMPITKMFTITKDGVNITVNKIQLPLTLAYTFTDYRAKGQTMALGAFDCWYWLTTLRPYNSIQHLRCVIKG